MINNKYIDLLQHIRQMFPHSTNVNITIDTNEEDKAQFDKYIRSTYKPMDVQLIGVDMEEATKQQITNFTFGLSGTIKLK